MNTKRLFRQMLILGLLAALSGIAIASVSAAYPEPDEQAPARNNTVGQAVIVDHNSVNIHAVPQHWIEEAKRTLHIAYGHTSHGSQLTSGMSGLVDFANDGGLGLALPTDIFDWNNGGTGGALDLHDYAMGGDVGYYPTWVTNTINYLGTPDPVTGRGIDQPDVNVIIWSWCGQASGRDEQSMLDTYLLPMTQLESEYPGVTFVYMTGHADGGGEEGDLHINNQQIREYCIENNKVMFDFYDIELYDPDGIYYGDKYVLDTCQYDGNGNGNPWDDTTNWAIDWQNSHTEDVDWYSVGCAHSQALNCNQKAYASWWLWARIAGWEGAGSQKTASTETTFHGQPITYTVVIKDTGVPLTATVYLTDDLPTGLSYLSGSLTSTSGTVDESGAPSLHWSGTLTPTPAVTVTYAVTVNVITPQIITNSAVIAAPGYSSITRTAAVTVVRPADYPDLSPSYKAVSPELAGHGERVTYTIGIRSDTDPLSLTVLLDDVVPPGVVYVPGTMTATRGIADDTYAPALTWSGPLTPTPAITITYAAVVTYVVPGSTAILPGTIVNTATITAPGYETIDRTATVRTNYQSIYLPLVLRD
ncbi:MAG: DUF11 domain-containing protein [Chloroflexi bacterium]|nr:DUF11 domain-containing protein [Chloroflexota bacterium]